MEAICSTMSFKLCSEKSDHLDAANSCEIKQVNSYARVAGVAEIGAAWGWRSFSELHSVPGSKVRLGTLLCRTENSREALGPI